MAETSDILSSAAKEMQPTKNIWIQESVVGLIRNQLEELKKQCTHSEGPLSKVKKPKGSNPRLTREKHIAINLFEYGTPTVKEGSSDE